MSKNVRRTRGGGLDGRYRRLRRAVMEWDAAERLAACNDDFRASFPGVRRGTHWSELLERFGGWVTVPRQELRRRVEESARRGAFELDVPMCDGRTLRLVSRPTDAGGRIAVLLDATEMLRRERELEEACSTAERASAAKTEFLAAMSHEVRTPLQSVLGYAELLLRMDREPLTAAQRAMVERILRSGALVQRVLDDVLDLARIEARGVALEVQDVSLEAVLPQVHEILAVAAAAQGVALHLPTDACQSVRADALRFAQILLNLGSNAIKYNRRGGWVHFSVAEDEESVRVTVSDSGLGVRPPERERLFRPFHRAGREHEAVAGTGIGLVVAERLAREMGGALGYAPHPEGGSSFWVALPRATGGLLGRQDGEPPRSDPPPGPAP